MTIRICVKKEKKKHDAKSMCKLQKNNKHGDKIM